MNNIVNKLLLISVILFGSFGNTEAKRIVTSVVVDGIDKPAYENDFAIIKLGLLWDKFLIVEIENKTEDRLYIEWENARLDNNKIVFGDDTMLTMRNEKTDEVVIAHAKTKKRLTRRDYVFENMVKKLTTKSIIKKNGSDSATFVLPIKYNEKTYDLLLNLKFTIE